MLLFKETNQELMNLGEIGRGRNSTTYQVVDIYTNQNYALQLRNPEALTIKWISNKMKCLKLSNILKQTLENPSFKIPKIFGLGTLEDEEDYRNACLMEFAGKDLSFDFTEKNAVKIAEFLYKLHQIKPKDLEGTKVIVKKNGYENDMYYPSAALEENSDGNNDIFREVFNYAKKRFIHGDFHSDNVSGKNGHLTIIDFEEARIDNPECDIYSICKQAPISFTKSLIHSYNELQNNKEDNLHPNFEQLMYLIQIGVNFCHIDNLRRRDPVMKEIIKPFINSDIEDRFEKLEEANSPDRFKIMVPKLRKAHQEKLECA